ncbi:MAG: adenylate/guanylate cyclase domain-containing protein [Chloroflexota bacterium]
MTPAAAPTKERKVATMLFADLVGFTSLNESTDPELVQALVTRAFDRLSAEVERYEGLVEKFAGDAMLVVFGVPTVHEDDAERAVRAALEMQSAMVVLAAELRAQGHPELSLRIGVETGEVLVDLGRASSERDRMVTGDPVNTAARLQSHAAPGAIVVGPGTYAATRELVDYEELPPATLKGKALPVAAWRAIRVKARRGGVRPALGMEAPLIGRDEEIALLKETVRRTVADGRPHLVTVVGSAGVGKSRLTWELEKYLDGLPEAFHWRKGRCLAYAQASFSALADAIKADAHILDDDAPATAAARLDARLAEIGGSDDPTLAPAIRALLAIGPTPDIAREDLLDAWRRYLTLLARISPLVLVQEDIHWADEGLLDFIDSLARWGEGPILVLCLARHELLERRPTWGGGIPNAATIVLEPLGSDEVARLVDALLAGGLPDALRARVVGLADGNPLFAEELVRMFVDRGALRFADGRWELAQAVDELEIPGSVHAVLAARLDALPAAEKRTAQDAAVVGRIFWDALLAHLARQGRAPTGELLRRLRVKELVVPRQPSALAGAAEFGFRHVLIRDVAYDSLPKRDRAAKHLDVARWAETALADREDELVELLAAHYLAALRYELELGGPDPDRLRELRARTGTYARRAGRRAESMGSKATAASWMRVAIEQAEALGAPARERAQLAVEYSDAASGTEPYRVLIAMMERALAELMADPSLGPDDLQLAARMRSRMAVPMLNDGRVAEVRALLETGIATLDPAGPSAGLALQRSWLGWTYWRAGPIAAAVPLLERAVEEARACSAADVERMALHDLGVAVSLLGDLRAAVPILDRSLALARAADDRWLLMRCFINVPSIKDNNGNPLRDFEPLLREGLAIARRRGDLATVGWITSNLAQGLINAGDLRQASEVLDEALAAAVAIEDHGRVSDVYVYRAWLRFWEGRPADAASEWAAAEAESAMGGGEIEPQMLPSARTVQARLRWTVDRAAGAAEGRRVLDLEETVGSGAIDVALILCRMALLVGDREMLEVAIDSGLRAIERCDGPVRLLDRRWLTAMRRTLDTDPDLPGIAAELRDVARGLEALDYVLPAAEILDDAARLEERAGGAEAAARAAADRAAARERYDACGGAPFLG